MKLRLDHMIRCLAGGLFFLLGLLISSPITLHASQPCEPPNVIPRPVCDMDSFHGSPPRQIPDGWNEFVFYGDPTFYQDDHSYWGGPNLTIWSVGGTFKAGIFTQVPVNPGAGYRASISWGAPNAPDLFSRQLGIDPTGGTDPNSPNIIWGPVHWGEGRILNYPPPDVNIDVRARAINSTITVFFVTDHPQSSGDNLILIDVIALYPDESAPAIQAPPTDTPTPEPPPAQPAEQVAVAAVALPTDTPIPTDTPTPLPTDTPVPTATFTPTPSPTPTATPSPTPTVTWTPWPTATADTGLTLQQAQVQILGWGQQMPVGLATFGLLSLGGAGLCVSSWWRLRRR